MTDTYNQKPDAAKPAAVTDETITKSENSAEESRTLLDADAPIDPALMESLRPAMEAEGTYPIHPDTKTENSPEPERPSAEDANSAELKYFLPKDAARGILANLLSEETCRNLLVQLVHFPGAVCPSCSAPVPVMLWGAFTSGKRLVCKSCGKEFTARTGTFLQGAQLSYAQVFLLAVLLDLMETGITPARIAPLVGVSEDTVRNWHKKFKAFEGPGGR